MYIWLWYFDISESVRRIFDGICSPIPPSEILAWLSVTGEIVYPFEIAILRAMDREYCAKMNEELQAYQARQRAAEQEAAEAARKRK